MARAPFSITTSERVKTAAGASPALKKTRWSGRANAAPGSTRITAPSPMKAVLSATATSSVGTSLPSKPVTCGSPAASACAIERILRPASRPARSESSGTKAPSTKTMRRPSIDARAAPAFLARALATASGRPASGLASRISARRSVYFHSSTRRCGRPDVSKRRKAFSRKAASVPPPGSADFAVAKLAARAVSAAVLIGRTSAFIATSRRFVPILRVAAGLQLQRQLLAAGAHDAAAREHVHHVRHDVVEQALIVRDHHEGALRRAQPVDAVGDDLERVDVEAGIGLIEHAKARLEQRHLQNLVALLLAAGKADIDPAAQHLLLDAELARDLAHALDEVRDQELGLAPLLALRVERGAQEGHGGDPRDFERILEGEKQALGGAFVRGQGENVLAVEQHLPIGHDVGVLAGEHMGERGLARAVRAHDGMHAALTDGKLEAVQDFFAVDLDVQILHFKHCPLP